MKPYIVPPHVPDLALARDLGSRYGAHWRDPWRLAEAHGVPVHAETPATLAQLSALDGRAARPGYETVGVHLRYRDGAAEVVHDGTRPPAAQAETVAHEMSHHLWPHWTEAEAEAFAAAFVAAGEGKR